MSSDDQSKQKQPPIAADSTTSNTSPNNKNENQPARVHLAVDTSSDGGSSTASMASLAFPLDPSYTPKALKTFDKSGHVFSIAKSKELAKSLALAVDDDSSERNESRVLVLYTGGTIGMKTHNGVYEPEPNYLPSALAKVPHLNDVEYVDQYFPNADPRPFCLPPVKFVDRRILYWIVEYEPLLDSSDMTFDDWIRIAKDIKHMYDKYDGFVVLHGTDTMAYTSSALSFMFEDLGKTVVITGAQIPIVEVRSDGRENLIGALVIAGGNYDIPEVTVYFNHKLFRGNRASKVDNSALDAFNTPNLPPLAELGIDIKIDQDAIFRPPSVKPFHVHQSLNRNVGMLRIFPSIPIAAVEAFFLPPMEGVVLQTFGAGNMPSKRADILNAIKKATERGVIVINCSQCIRGQVDIHYACGKILMEAGVMGGSDMTVEAALTKLSYVLGRDQWSVEKKRKAMRQSLRGELTVPYRARNSTVSGNPMFDVLPRLIKFFRAGSSQEVKFIKEGILPHITCAAAMTDDIALLESLKEAGAKFSAVDFDERTALHVAAQAGHVRTVEYLLKNGLSVHAKDRWCHTPLDCAIQGRHTQVIQQLKKVGGHIGKSPTAIGVELCHLAVLGDVEGISAWLAAGAALNAQDYNGQTMLHAAAMRLQVGVIKYLLALHIDRSKKDSFGRTALDAAQQIGNYQIVELLSGITETEAQEPILG